MCEPLTKDFSIKKLTKPKPDANAICIQNISVKPIVEEPKNGDGLIFNNGCFQITGIPNRELITFKAGTNVTTGQLPLSAGFYIFPGTDVKNIETIKAIIRLDSGTFNPGSDFEIEILKFPHTNLVTDRVAYFSNTFEGSITSSIYNLELFPDRFPTNESIFEIKIAITSRGTNATVTLQGLEILLI